MKHLIALIAAAATLIPLQAAVTLASGGKTVYTIVAPENPTREEKAAVKDLRWHLNYITKADFKIGKAGEKNIFVGRKAPSDNKPLGRYERRIRSENGNVYLYGNGRQGNTFAVYDFLEQYFDCQWYSFFNDMKIPIRREASFDKLEKNIIPSFNHTSVYGSIYNSGSKRGNDFRRRARFYDIRDPHGSAVTMLGSNYPHMPSRMIPSGFVKYGDNRPVSGPLKYFKNKKYFETNPEFFSIGRGGERNWQYQLCYSNKGLRKELIKNHQIVIDNEYKGGEAKFFVDLNDKGKFGMSTCYCKGCLKLNKKYGNPAGAYWDFCIELGNHFLHKYPDIRFQVSIYQITREVPANLPPLPANITASMAPLDETDFLKPYSDGSKAYDMLLSWSKVITGDFNLWGYPTVYPRPLFTRPLVANINRIVQNMRDCHKLGVNEFEMEFGVGPIGAVGFNELRMYLIARLSNNINIDVKAAIEDFMRHYYGEKAAPIMLKYYYELEDCEKKETRFMRWWPDHRSCLTYLTPENILRWQGYFDEMLKITDRHSRWHFNIRRARLNLDEATLSIWYKFAPGTMPDRDVILKRHTATTTADTKDILYTFYNKKDAKRLYDSLVNRHNWRPIYYHYALAGEWKALPEPFGSMPKSNILRTVPYVNRGLLIKDKEAATGLTTTSQGKIAASFAFTAARWEKTNVEKRETFPKKITLAEVKAKKGYNFYHIGSTRLYPDMNIYFSMIYAGGVTLGYLYDEKNPEQVYDIYVSIKYDEKNDRIMSDQVVLVKAKGKTEKLKEEKIQRINDPGQFA